MTPQYWFNLPKKLRSVCAYQLIRQKELTKSLAIFLIDHFYRRPTVAERFKRIRFSPSRWPFHIVYTNDTGIESWSIITDYWTDASTTTTYSYIARHISSSVVVDATSYSDGTGWQWIDTSESYHWNATIASTQWNDVCWISRRWLRRGQSRKFSIFFSFILVTPFCCFFFLFL